MYRAWRRIADSYPGDRVLIGEVWLPDVERTTRYLRSGELQTVFNFDFLRWSPPTGRRRLAPHRATCPLIEHPLKYPR